MAGPIKAAFADPSKAQISRSSRPCNICGGHEFKPGPRGRLALERHAPWCVKCRSMERHRIIYGMYQKLQPFLWERTALQMAPDVSLVATWFKKLDVSRFGGDNSLDFEKLDLTDGAYDILIANHVLEHVADDIQALREALRVVGPAGLVHICVPDPIRRFATDDWGYPKPEMSLHYRDYGIDIVKRFRAVSPDLRGMAVVAQDPVTTAADSIFLLSYSMQPLATIFDMLQHSMYSCVLIA